MAKVALEMDLEQEKVNLILETRKKVGLEDQTEEKIKEISQIENQEKIKEIFQIENQQNFQQNLKKNLNQNQKTRDMLEKIQDRLVIDLIEKVVIKKEKRVVLVAREEKDLDLNQKMKDTLETKLLITVPNREEKMDLEIKKIVLYQDQNLVFQNQETLLIENLVTAVNLVQLVEVDLDPDQKIQQKKSLVLL